MISLKSIFSGGANGFLNKVQILTSQSWTVPAGIYKVLFLVTGGGGGGGGSATADSGGGGAASPTGVQELAVAPGQIFDIVVGAGGAGGAGAGGALGGHSYVYRNSVVYVASLGGNAGISSGGNSAPALATSCFVGGDGGSGTGAGANGAQGYNCIPQPVNIGTATDIRLPSVVVSAGGTGNANGGGGGGGGSSYYGAGGNGASTPGNGSNATATNYGAGGGGASGNNSGSRNGGNGANGIVEIYY